MHRFIVIKNDFKYIYTKVVWLLDLLLWIFFFSTALTIFRVKEGFVEWGKEFFTKGIKVGAVEITLWSILLFFPPAFAAQQLHRVKLLLGRWAELPHVPRQVQLGPDPRRGVAARVADGRGHLRRLPGGVDCVREPQVH